MPLVLINGISTSGKSSVAKELRARGHEAHDTEHNGISAWYHKTLNTRDAEFGQVPERTKEWFDAHEWRIDVEWVKRKAEEAKNKTVFLCGVGANEQEVWPLCDKIVWLQTDEATIRARVTIPRDHTYGTKPHELAAAITGNVAQEAVYREAGALLIDARRSLTEVVDDILKLA